MKVETLIEIVNRNPAPTPWSEGDNIPWNEPDFSERMLNEHLAQEHDAASRRSEKIKRHIAWIHEQANLGQPGRLLDLGCGPGLYAIQLARLGYQVTGIDYAPASIAYAQAQAAQQGQKIRYILGDIRQAEYAADDGGAYDCAMQVYGESNVFRPSDLRKILRKIHNVLRSAGLLIP